jgi:hypothetical protein
MTVRTRKTEMTDSEARRSRVSSHLITVPSLVTALAAALAVGIVAAGCGSSDTGPGEAARLAEFEESVVAGGPDAFMEVRHLTLRGSNFAIGRKLAEIARDRHHVKPLRYPRSRDTVMQKRYFLEYYPVFIDRMQGVAALYGKNLDNNSYNFAALYYGMPDVRCSVVYYPPGITETGTGVLSRNFDSSTGMITGGAPRRGELATCARPYLIEMYPDSCYASLVMCCFDLLGGVCDGINSAGLTVAILSDADVITELGARPTKGPREGLDEIQILRFLLDTCADTKQAQAALRQAKRYYSMIPNHYIVADAEGRSFIWENSTSMNTGYVINGGERPLVTTNFLLHRYPDTNELPSGNEEVDWFARYTTIRERIDAHEGTFDVATIKEINRCVASRNPLPKGTTITHRTLWHALYFPEELRVEIDFYLGEEGTDEKGKPKIARSGYRSFTLKSMDK